VSSGTTQSREHDITDDANLHSGGNGSYSEFADPFWPSGGIGDVRSVQSGTESVEDGFAGGFAVEAFESEKAGLVKDDALVVAAGGGLVAVEEKHGDLANDYEGIERETPDKVHAGGAELGGGGGIGRGASEEVVSHGPDIGCGGEAGAKAMESLLPAAVHVMEGQAAIKNGRCHGLAEGSGSVRFDLSGGAELE
jgi:hypothetical protein